MFFSSDMLTTREGRLQTGIINIIVMSTIVGGAIGFVSLAFATGAIAFLCRLGWRYRASSLGQFIARLPGVRLIPYLHRKYWLHSGVPLHPRPRFFHLKRFIIRQSNFTVIFPVLFLLNSVSCSC